MPETLAIHVEGSLVVASSCGGVGVGLIVAELVVVGVEDTV
jgi:hypothetical protein